MPHAVEIPVPSSWRQVAPPKTEYAVADQAVVTISVVQGLPEDPHEWIKVEVARRAGAQPASPPTMMRLMVEAGWPALIGEAAIGDRKLLIVMYQFLELGAVAMFDAPAATYDAHQAGVREVLMRAQIRWGAPPTTIAALLDGAVRSS